MRAPFSLWMNFPRYSPSFEVFVNDVVSVFLYSTQIGKRMTEILSVVSDLAEAPIYFCTLLSCAFCRDRWWTQNVEVGLQICYLDPSNGRMKGVTGCGSDGQSKRLVTPRSYTLAVTIPSREISCSSRNLWTFRHIGAVRESVCNADISVEVSKIK